MTSIVTEGNVTHLPDPASDDAIILQSLKTIEARSRTLGRCVQNACAVRNYLRLPRATEHGLECLFTLFIEPHYGVTNSEVLCQGGLKPEGFEPLPVQRLELGCNATAAIFSRNRPPGSKVWSRADQQVTA